MRLRQISEGKLDTIGHVALDVAGLVPGIGEPADLANALWYAKKGDYFSSVLSLISLIPELGDLIGKGIKYLGKSSKLVAKFLEKYGDDIARHWPKIVKSIEKMKEWKPYVRKLDEVVNKIKSGEDEEGPKKVDPDSIQFATYDDLRGLQEWKFLRSKEWKEGYKRGLAGKLRESEDSKYMKGWIQGYKEFVWKTRPDLR